MINTEEMIIRAQALELSKKHMDDIVDKFPPEMYKTTHGPTGVLVTPVGSFTTPAETATHILLDLATWLIGDTD